MAAVTHSDVVSLDPATISVAAIAIAAVADVAVVVVCGGCVVLRTSGGYLYIVANYIYV